jgi:putative ABC transport system substrate-binding protein
MRRRTFIGAIAGSLVPPLFAQPQRKLPRVGYLTPTGSDSTSALLAPLIEGLRKRGFTEGQTIAFDVRTAENDFGRLPALAANLVQAKVDVIVAVSPLAILAASRATKTIPIVMAFWGGEGLLESGVVANLARPGGNVTGVSMLADELERKRLELLLNAFPKARRIAIISTRKGDTPIREVVQVANAAKIELVMSQVPGQNGYDPVFAAIARDNIDAAMVPSFPRFALEYEGIVAAAAAQRVPAIYEWGYMARAGGLMAYGAEIAELEDRVADYVARILKGAKPANMPVEQPTKFELVINLRTAKALGIAIPQSLLVRADEVIQ